MSALLVPFFHNPFIIIRLFIIYCRDQPIYSYPKPSSFRIIMGNMHSSTSDQSSSAKSSGWGENAASTAIKPAIDEAVSQSAGHGLKGAVALAVAAGTPICTGEIMEQGENFENINYGHDEVYKYSQETMKTDPPEMAARMKRYYAAY